VLQPRVSKGKVGNGAILRYPVFACHGRVERSNFPNLRALNFLLQEVLDSGGTVALQADPKGTLRMEVEASLP